MQTFIVTAITGAEKHTLIFYWKLPFDKLTEGHGIYYSVKHFPQPINLPKVSKQKKLSSTFF